MMQDLVADTIVQPLSDDSLSISPEDSIEYLLEQKNDIDESSILDLLQDESAGVFAETAVKARSRLSRKLRPPRGFSEGKYLGSSIKSYQRIRITQGKDLAAGFIIEKDAGETRLNDFTVGYIRASNLGPIASFIVGDYVIEAGQGIALWRGFDFQKGADVVHPAQRRGKGLVPYAASDENYFFRGTAATFVLSDFILTTFYSERSMSASLDTAGNISSVYTAGYFRTESERTKRNNFSEKMFGAHGEYHFSSDHVIGATSYTANYSRNFFLSGGRFTGDNLNLIAADYGFSFQKVRLFGEWAMTNGVAGGISGMHLAPGRFIDIVIAYRNYPSEFFNLHNNGFGERSGTANERGWYVGVQLHPIHRVRVNGYFDQFSFPSPSASTVFSGEGHEVFIQADVSMVPHLLVTPRFRRKVTLEKKTTIDSFGRTRDIDDQKTQQGFRLTGDYRLDPKIKVRTRVEYLDLEYHYVDRKEHGFLILQDLMFEPSPRLTLHARVALFRTDSFDSGMSEYENDLPGVLTVPILYGRGVRWYLLATYSLLTSFQVSLKYSELIRDDVKTIGSGLDELLTNSDNRISLQLDFSF